MEMEVTKEWKTFNNADCPSCGAEIEVLTECLAKDDTPGETFYMDGDYAVCVNRCGYESAISADGEEAWLQDGNIDELSEG